MIIIEDDSDGIVILNNHLAKLFEMKSFSPLHFIGIEVASSANDYVWSWTKYILDIFNRADLADEKTITAVSEYNVKLYLNDDPLLHDPLNIEKLLAPWCISQSLVLIYSLL